MMRAWPLLLSCQTVLASSFRTFFAFCGALLTTLRATRPRLIFKIFPILTFKVDSPSPAKQLSNVREV